MSWQHHKHCHSYYYYYYYYLLDLRPRPFCLALKHTVFIADITVKPTRQACCCLNVNEYLFYEHVYPVLTWRRHTSQSTERRRHPLLVVVTWDLPTLASSSFHAWGQVTATVVSPFMVPSCGILCHTTCGQLTYPWPHSEIDWKHSCLTLTRSSTFVALVNFGYISDIIIII